MLHFPYVGYSYYWFEQNKSFDKNKIKKHMSITMKVHISDTLFFSNISSTSKSEQK